MTKFPSLRSSIVPLLFVAAVLFLFFFGLSIPLVGPDEPRYSQVAREMFERGDWITPTLGGYNWFEKPALLYWLQIAAYHLFGVSEFAARFGSALAGLGTVLSLWILGRAVGGKDATHTVFANWLALIAASTVSIIAFAHGASFDIILTFPITAALVAFFIYDRTDRQFPLAAFYFFIGLALLAKGLIGIVLPYAIVGSYFLLSRRMPRRDLLISLIWGTAISIAVASLWYLPMYLRHGYAFIDEFFIQHHFERYTSNKYLHPQPFYFFLWVLPLMTIPWLPFFFAALLDLSERAYRSLARGETKSPSPLVLFALSWLIVPVVFFSFSGSKLPGYILPAVPAALIITANFIHRFVDAASWRRYLVTAIAAGTIVLLAIGIVTVVPGFAESDTVKGLFAEADRRGLNRTPVLILHGVSHNAEFYAPGRIIRDAQGKQMRTFGTADVVREMRLRNNEPLLVLVSLEYLPQLVQSDLFRKEVIKDNGDMALAVVYPL